MKELALLGMGEHRSLRFATIEVLETLARAPQWGTLAWNDIKLRYRRTTLGPLWITLGLGATVFSVGILYGVIFGNELARYLPYFGVGLITWTFISTAIGEGCTAYLGAAAIIKAIPVPPAVHIFRLMVRQLINLAHHLVLVVVLWLMFPWQLTSASLLVVPAFVLNAIVLFGAVMTLSIIAARFRDIQLIVTTILQLLFLLTPIIWQADSLRGAALVHVVNWNPFFHMIEIVRQPLLGKAPMLVSWLSCCGLAVLSVTCGTYFYARYRHRIPFWV